jgi:hypothetical protein
VLSFSIFIFILPGISDPENFTERRVPFFIVTYFAVTFLFLIYVNINRQLSYTVNGYITMFPFLFALSIHVLMLATELF